MANSTRKRSHIEEERIFLRPNILDRAELYTQKSQGSLTQGQNRSFDPQELSSRAYKGS